MTNLFNEQSKDIVGSEFGKGSITPVTVNDPSAGYSKLPAREDHRHKLDLRDVNIDFVTSGIAANRSMQFLHQDVLAPYSDIRWTTTPGDLGIQGIAFYGPQSSINVHPERPNIFFAVDTLGAASSASVTSGIPSLLAPAVGGEGLMYAVATETTASVSINSYVDEIHRSRVIVTEAQALVDAPQIILSGRTAVATAAYGALSITTSSAQLRFISGGSTTGVIQFDATTARMILNTGGVERGYVYIDASTLQLQHDNDIVFVPTDRIILGSRAAYLPVAVEEYNAPGFTIPNGAATTRDNGFTVSLNAGDVIDIGFTVAFFCSVAGVSPYSANMVIAVDLGGVFQVTLPGRVVVQNLAANAVVTCHKRFKYTAAASGSFRFRMVGSSTSGTWSALASDTGYNYIINGIR